MSKLIILLFTTLLSFSFAQDAAWMTMPLTNVATGESFTLADFKGQTVYVEPMATWCPNCLQQLGNVKGAQAKAGADVTFVALSVETYLNPDDLAAYAQKEGFEMTFAVMTPEMARALSADFGQGILVPPATPHFYISPDGSHGDLVTGYTEADAIIAALQ